MIITKTPFRMGDKVRSVVRGFASTITGSTGRVRSAASRLASGIRTGLMSGLEGKHRSPVKKRLDSAVAEKTE